MRDMKDRRKMNKRHYLLLLKRLELTRENTHMQLKLEKTIFFSLANRDDVKKVLGKEPMAFNDFDRIFYILQSLNLNTLGFVMFRDHYKDFKKELDATSIISSEWEIHKEIRLHIRWLEDFCEHIENPYCAKIVREIFELPI